MTRPRLNLAFVILAALGLIAVHEFAPDGLYSFGGHAHALHVGFEIILWLLFLTHGFLALIMWAQRETWDDAEAATFLFIGGKALFWANTAESLKPAPGINLTIAYLAVIVLVSTVNLDIRLMQRYVLRRRGTEAL